EVHERLVLLRGVGLEERHEVTRERREIGGADVDVVVRGRGAEEGAALRVAPTATKSRNGEGASTPMVLKRPSSSTSGRPSGLFPGPLRSTNGEGTLP